MVLPVEASPHVGRSHPALWFQQKKASVVAFVMLVVAPLNAGCNPHFLWIDHVLVQGIWTRTNPNTKFSLQPKCSHVTSSLTASAIDMGLVRARCPLCPQEWQTKHGRKCNPVRLWPSSANRYFLASTSHSTNPT